ncbi:hypothetical protein FN976_11460 [Caenimonas sedimenti]|uniref:Phosphoribosyltransferase n=1 Tax=Caenimonas sedimenti TaxID=2596921 RepID=A0A562ZTR0_9BURK|nr:hypothetical protein [Caenimonas sedimenti]TWO71524.1 hypothetical protein FN976_11460 [Caenimonas sedimenti]
MSYRFGRAADVDLDVRELLVFDGHIPASHTAAQPPSPQRTYESLAVDPVEEAKSAPNLVYLFDDVLKSGANLLAAMRRLREVFPNQPIIGNFDALHAPGAARAPELLEDAQVP